MPQNVYSIICQRNYTSYPFEKAADSPYIQKMTHFKMGVTGKRFYGPFKVFVYTIFDISCVQ